MAKEYGLITKKGSSSSLIRHAVFDSDSDSDEDSSKFNTKVNLSLGKLQEKQIKKAQQSALADDPTIYQYDEIFDEVQSKQKALKEASKNTEKNSKYIKTLLKTADRRKRDYERHIERQVQKEREADADEFKDKESFVTSSYRQKLEEMKKAEEQEKREEYLEAIGDVTKQRDLGGFYRHLYEQKLGPDKPKIDAVEEQTGDNSSPKQNDNDDKIASSIHIHKQTKERNYRKRKSIDDDDDNNDDDKLKHVEHLPCNLDADSDFSIDSDSDDQNMDKSHVIPMEADEIKKENTAENLSRELNVHSKIDNVENVDEKSVKLELLVEEQKMEIETPKVKINKWEKRTVGDVFDAALQRYFERKALRQSS